IVGCSTNSTVEYTQAAVTPIDTKVSMVELPCRAALSAPRWKGQPAQKVTGNDSTIATQPQRGNWNAVSIEIRNSGTVKIAATINRGFSAAAPGGSSTAGASTVSSSSSVGGVFWPCSFAS